ncbi:MAG TPA: DsbA family protein [Verrucomicrobiae bacterium]|nr:DsbA family protein [Verrucomicrobiae bacterium]
MKTGAGQKLHPPVSKRDHIQGPANAAMTLVEYGDYECPACGQAYQAIKEVQRALNGRLRFVFRNFPLSMHPHAEEAAEAAEAAAAQGKFWEMHDALFENQEALEDEGLITYAEQIGLDARRLATEIEGGAHIGRVREDFDSGVHSGVEGTPTYFINGLRYDGAYDPESLIAALMDAGE